jgi:putative addiction module component (TIGR02574 family)
MAATLENLYEAAMGLSDEVRLKLVEKLIPTIAPDRDVEAEQMQVVLKRIEEIESGVVKPVPGEEVFRRVQASLDARHKA